jgi:D-3-phosphoglycerate dehydrogenase
VVERIVVADKLGAAGLELLRAIPGFDVQDVAGRGVESLEQALSDAVVLVVRSETKVTAAVMAQAPRLRIIARAGMGVDTIDLAEANRRRIAVLTAPGANSNSVAEFTFALLLGLVRKVPGAVASLGAGSWDRKSFEGTELRGKTLGLIGLGRVGSGVAAIARGFGMTVQAYDPRLTAHEVAPLGVALLPLDDVLRNADVVSLHAKLTPETRHLLDDARLAATKKGVVIVNTSRGALIDDAALVRALRSGHVAGAALDVYDPEPLAADSVLRGAPNVLLTPHLAASAREAQTRVAIEIGEAVRAALLNGDLSAAVNRKEIGAV